ncbi:SPOSA6832_04532, partial [Sporobolomyces salmonicolor]
MASSTAPRSRRSLVSLLIALLLVFAACIPSAEAAALLAVDYGTDSFKASLVKPGVPFDVLLTKEGKRKTPSLVAFRGEDRFVGGDAASLDTISSVKLLLAHPPSHPQSKLHSSLFSTPQSTTSRLSPAVATSAASFPVEEVLAVQLVYAKELAEEQAKESVRDTVITVPGWFGEPERKAVLDAAEVAGLRVVGLVNDGTAAAVNYAMSRTFPPSPSHHLIYDLGSGSLRTTLVSFKSAMLPDPLSLSDTPQLKNVTALSVHGYGFDLEVGGYVLDETVREMLVEGFEQGAGKQLREGKSVRNDKRAMAKLLKEAGRVKQVLSANTAAQARIEGLIDDIDFRLEVTRADLESRSAALLPRLTKPIQDALDSAKLTLNDIESVILVGGTSRVPMVQKAVAEAVGEDKIAKNVNADEAAVLGAALYGAGITRGFRTKDIRVQDLTPFGIDVAYQADQSATDAEPRTITTHLFPAFSKTASKKTLTMRKTDDFALEFSYRKTGSPYDAYLPSHLFSTSLKGISAAVANLTAEAKANATVKVTVELDASGLLKVSKATLVLREEDNDTKADKGGVTDKLKGLLSKFSAGKNASSTTASAPDADKTGADGKGEANSTLTLQETAELEALLKAAQLPPAQVKLETVTVSAGAVAPMSNEEKGEVRKRLREAKAALQRKLAREEARNLLEAYVYRVRDLVDQEAFVASSVEHERKAIRELNEKTGDWLWDEGESAATKELKDKKKELEKLVKHILARSTEATQRPLLVAQLRDLLSSSTAFFSSAQANQTAAAAASAPQRFTADELEKLAARLSESATWLDESVKKQDKVKGHEDPVLRTAELERRITDLEGEVKKLERKKVPRGTTKVKASSRSSSTSTATAAATAGEEETPRPQGEHKKDEL